MCLKVLHLLLVHVQEELHGLGQVVEIIELTVAVSENLTCTVITSDNHVTLVGVDDVVSCQRGIA